MQWLAEQMPAGYCFRATSNVFLVQKGRRPGTARHASVGKPRENARPSPREIRFRRYVAVGERIDEGRQIHDENANDHLDTNVLGLPTEGYALSNGARPVRRNRIVPHLYAALTPEYRNPSRSFMCAYVALSHRRELPRPGGE